MKKHAAGDHRTARHAGPTWKDVDLSPTPDDDPIRAGQACPASSDRELLGLIGSNVDRLAGSGGPAPAVGSSSAVVMLLAVVTIGVVASGSRTSTTDVDTGSAGPDQQHPAVDTTSPTGPEQHDGDHPNVDGALDLLEHRYPQHRILRSRPASTRSGHRRCSDLGTPCAARRFGVDISTLRSTYGSANRSR